MVSKSRNKLLKISANSVLAFITVTISTGGVASALSETQISTQNFPKVGTGSSEIKIILNILFAVLGAIALLVITIAGFRYIVSRGEPQAIARAKDTIIYALIGLVIAILAFSIVNFVVGNI